MKAAEKRKSLAALTSGEAALAVGTHALISEDVEYASLGLVITDEQHRFGVKQRAALSAKGRSPHVLVMSATPIPRTLALIIYGDLDVSIIDELPPGRQKVDTFAVASSYRRRLNGFIAKLVGEGRQVFVVCPAIESDPDIPMDLTSAEEHTEELRRALPELRIECIHGKMKAKPRDEIMARFAAGEIDVLVSTTVIEVGVDVPKRGADDSGERGAFRPQPAAPAARPRGPRPVQELLCAGLRREKRGGARAPGCDDAHTRRLPHSRGGPAPARPGRLFRGEAARPAGAAHRGPGRGHGFAARRTELRAGAALLRQTPHAA